MSKLNHSPTTEHPPPDRHRNTHEVTPLTPLSPLLQNWLDSQNFKVKATMDKNGVVEFLNNQEIPVKRNAVIVAINRREIESALLSGKRLVSEYAAMKWILAKQVIENAESVNV